MRSYEVTERGEQIVLDSGVNALVQKVLDAEYLEDAFLYQVSRPDYMLSSFDLDELDVAEEQLIANALKYARSQDEQRALARGLNIDPESQAWRYLAPSDQPTLFPHPQAHTFTPATDEDRFIVSGAFGTTLSRYKSGFPILDRSRFADFGFSNHMEACAFVGACVIGKVAEIERARIDSKMPSFEIDDPRIKKKVSVGGTFHGDFVIELTRSPKRDVVSPASAMVEFTPKETFAIGGYHSVEPAITGALFADEYGKHGIDATRALVTELGEVIEEFVEEGGNVSFERGNFGDYGSGNSRYALIKLRTQLDYPETATESDMHERKLFSGPYLPQSDTMFELKSIPEGLRFQMRDMHDKEPTEGIDVPRQYYPELLRALMLQAQAGLGRTSPMQHIEVVQLAQSMLEEHK